MLGFIRVLLLGLLLIGFGWLAGSIFPAPEQWTAIIKGRADPLLARLDLTPDGLARLRQSLSPEEFSTLSRNAAHLAASTGDVIMIDRSAADESDADAVQPARPPANAQAFETALQLCPGMSVANAPRADASRKVLNYTPFVAVNGVTLAVNPTHGACFSSGFGPRDGRNHRGIDLHARDGGPVFAAAGGTVIEKVYRDDFGNMLLIDHGSGVYTRYAHLSSFTPDLGVGARVAAGDRIGLMGNTAAYPIPVHLHYELLLGDYANPRGSFGLTPHSPFEYPAAPSQQLAQRPAPAP